MASNKISYTNKDASSIFSEAVGLIPLLTDKWKNFAEDDPGIVIIKLASYIADMLCYNMDFQVNETFPQTALFRSHAQNSYDLIGYKMHWYRSAECKIMLTLTRPEDIPSNQAITLVLPEFAELVTPEGIPYVIIGNITARTIILSANQTTVSKEFIAVQGSSIRQLNITMDKIIRNGRIYIENFSIDEDEQNDPDYAHMHLYTYDAATDLPLESSEWTKVENLLDIREQGRYYELRVDEQNQPYIQLCDDYEEYISQTNNYLGLTYIISSGSSGAVAENIGFLFNTTLAYTYDNVPYDMVEYITITNTQSSQGRNPETVAEAALTAPKEARTLGVAITLADYEILCTKVDGIRACLAQDYTTSTTLIENLNLLSILELTDGVITLKIPDLTGYMIEPGSVSITLIYNSGTEIEVKDIILEENAPGILVDSTTEVQYGLSYINYQVGWLQLDFSGLSPALISGNIEGLTITFQKTYAPYNVILKLVGNDYAYISEYTKETLSTLLDKRTIVPVSYHFENANVKSIPFNISIYSYEPYQENNIALTSYISEVVSNVLFDYFNSTSRIFGEKLSYPSLNLLVQNADTKIQLADIDYPIRNIKLNPDEYPRLGPVCTNLSDNPNLIWLQDKIFDLDTAEDVYLEMLTNIFGASSSDDPSTLTTLLNGNTWNAVDGPLTLTNSVSIPEYSVTLPVTWWCSRPDLVIVDTSNQTIWGNLNAESILETTPITLYAMIHYNDASLVLAEMPVNLILKKYEV